MKGYGVAGMKPNCVILPSPTSLRTIAMVSLSTNVARVVLRPSVVKLLRTW